MNGSKGQAVVEICVVLLVLVTVFSGIVILNRELNLQFVEVKRWNLHF